MHSSEFAGSGERQERLATWVQFPRRVVLTLGAFGLVLGLIAALRQPLLRAAGGPPGAGQEPDWSVSWTMQMPVTTLIGERLPNTLVLLGAALLLALLLACAASIVAVLVHYLEEKAGWPGSVVKGVGRLSVFSAAAMPVFCMAMVLISIFAIRLSLLPAVGMLTPSGAGGLGDRISHLILPVLALALLPATLTAQAVAREVTLPREHRGIRLWLAGLFKGLGVCLGQTGGLLGAAVLVEGVFSWPGIGRLALEAAMRQDYPVLLGVLSVYAGMILVGRLAAELFRWLERLVHVPVLDQPVTPRGRRAHRIWMVIALALLLIPLGFAAAGLTVDPGALAQTDAGARGEPPSADHPWGTDMLGRDLQARVLRGAAVTLGTAALVAVTVLLPGGLIGALVGLLASCRTWWAESVADLLLLPADVLLFIPAVPGAMAMMLLLPRAAGTLRATWAWLGLVCALVLLPRAVRMYQTLWTTAPEQRRGLVLGLAGSGVLLLGTLFAGLGLVAALDFLGLGIPSPTPSLGGVLSEALRLLPVSPHVLLAGGAVLGACAFACFTAADALVGLFSSKEPLARLNE
jgi:peptide/nickel transport system permease protein